MKKLIILALGLTFALAGCTLPGVNQNKVSVIKPEEAKTMASSFIQNYLVDPSATISLGDLTDVSGVYQMEVTLSPDQKVTAYMTKDGKYFFTQGLEVSKVKEETAAKAEAAKSAKVETQILVEGKGDQQVKSGDSVTVNYKGTLEDGTVFDSSYEKKQPFTVTLGQGNVIQGWEQGLIGMKVGEKRKLIIPPSLAYGDQGSGSTIPPNSTLIFEVELMSINPTPATAE